MFGIETLDQVPKELSVVYERRLASDKLPENHEVLRGPVGLFVVREDGAGGSKLAQEVVGSFGYWSDRSKHYFDGVFLGWGFDGGCPIFMPQQFLACVEQLESTLNWQFKGVAHLLLTDFVYDAGTREGRLDFSRSIPLEISPLLKKEKMDQLSPFIEKLIAPVRRDREQIAETSVWQISDAVAILRARQMVWHSLVKKMGLMLGLVDALAPYAVRDLRKHSTKTTA